MKVILSTTLHELQRYPTVGDWITDGRGHLRDVRVSEMGNEDYHFLVGLHELVEGWLCAKRGITDADVTAFDEAFEAKRAPGNTDEPGDDPQAPYRREHQFATLIERLVAFELGVNWEHYDKTVVEL